MSLQICYLEDSGKTDNEYISFLEKFHGKAAQSRFERRVMWYKRGCDFKILVAILNSVVVGQSCAYKTTAIIDNKPTEWWWGVDAFVLTEARGCGIGKKLQKKLYEDCPNFSSAWYSPTNGHVKKVCGAKEVFPIGFYFYPSSIYFSLYLRLAILKIIKKDIGFYIRLPFLYTKINNLFKNDYSIKEISFDNSVISFANQVLKSKYDFYIERTKEFFTWKYSKNPSLSSYIWAEITDKTGNRCAVLSFTTNRNATAVVLNVKGVKVLDMFIAPTSNLSEKQAIILIMDYFRKRNLPIDGVCALQRCNYFPTFCYPIKGVSLLSSYEGKKIGNPYISYIDQDMEQ